MTGQPDVIIAWKFDVARNAMGSGMLTAYVNRFDRAQAWLVLRSELPHADLMSEAGLSATELASHGQSPFTAGEDLRWA